MSEWEEIEDVADDLREITEAELEEFMRNVFDGIREDWRERRLHNADGFFADLAGESQCQDLGHDVDESGEFDEDTHPYSWDGERLCLGTKYGKACTACEGECSLEQPPSLWKLVSA